MIPPAPLYTAESVGISSAPLKASGAAVPPPGVDAAPPWTDPHKDDSVKPVGKSQCRPQSCSITHALNSTEQLSEFASHVTSQYNPRLCIQGAFVPIANGKTACHVGHITHES